jgi:hypothetical protein
MLATTIFVCITALPGGLLMAFILIKMVVGAIIGFTNPYVQVKGSTCTGQVMKGIVSSPFVSNGVIMDPRTTGWIGAKVFPMFT